MKAPKKAAPVALKVVQWPIGKLKAYEKNPRKNDHAVDRMAATLKEFGFRIPIVATSDGKVVDGHLRLKGAVKAGIKRVPVALADDLTPAQIKAFRILANKSAEWADWDDDLLRIEIAELKADDFDIGVLGFDDDELNKLFLTGTEGNDDPDAEIEPPANPVSRLGDIWVLGEHRLICGDSTSADVVAQVMAGRNPYLMVTDPPYGVEYDASWRDDALGGKRGGRATGIVKNDDKVDWRLSYDLFKGQIAYIWHAGNKAHLVAESLIASEFEIRSQIIWSKSQFVIGRGHYHPHHEPCWYAVRKGKTGRWNGDRKQTTVWEIDKPQKSETGHSTQKPVECMKRPMENNSKPGDFVYDPFMGSGTSIIAGEMTGRKIIGCELNPAYVDVCVERWQRFSGRKATLQESGDTFASVAADRGIQIEEEEAV